MTTGELIEALSAFPSSARVRVEGCDCYGDALCATLENGIVFIRRPDGDDTAHDPAFAERIDTYNEARRQK